MSKSVATASNEGHESLKTSGKRGARYEGNEDEEEILEVPLAESLPISRVVSTVPATTDQFMFTNDFKRLLVDLVQGDTLMTLRFATKAWKCVVDAFIDEGVASGAVMVHGGKGISLAVVDAREGGALKMVTRVVFLLNITKVGDSACYCAFNLIVVDVPEGVVSIGDGAFAECYNLTTVYFPTTLKSIGACSFIRCQSLDNVDLRHTNLQELGVGTFESCRELKSMTIPDSLQTLGRDIFRYCSKLVPSSIDINYSGNDVTSGVVIHLRLKQRPLVAEKIKQEKIDARARRVEQRQERKEKK
ncbi:hypothetical protein TL16_g13022 [Triparma laevis f. inornata]|uniref:Uncharacterized protein n=2 Tax=Triparma laevis TaxID=1534972 RepID=A0A9W7A124_9STRA|nr:hypothetical protein TrLO_g2221 [Triparma laevis f. longispina]GMH94865.1 hypothetical protein TL16_g13022 [Triparma laevis f. inornata]